MNYSEEISEPEAIEALADCVQQVWNNASVFTGKSQSATTVNKFFEPCENNDWTSGFWKGELNLAFEASHDPMYKQVAEHQLTKLLHFMENNSSENKFFQGTVISPSCISAWNISKNEDAKEAIILAADEFIFNTDSIFVHEESAETKEILSDKKILLNIPMLSFASQLSGNKKYKQTAEKIVIAATKIIADDSIGPGYKKEALEEDILSWRLYGLALAAKYFPEDEQLALFRYLAEEYISGKEKNELTDTSSAALVTCALIEMANQLRAADELKFITEIEILEKQSAILLKNLVYDFAVQSPKSSNGLLFTVTEDGSEECTSWGDYFYMEALTRFVKPNWKGYF